MNLPAASRATIEALVRGQRLRDEQRPTRVIGVQARTDWIGPASFAVDGESVRVVPCRSALEVRSQLAERDDPAEWLVLLTDRDERDLGRDVLVRLARRRLEPIDAWSAVAGSFGALGVETSLRRIPDLAGALLEHRPPTGYAPIVGTVLDRDTAWTAYADRVLGLAALDRDPAVGVLEWLSSGDAAVTLAAVSPQLADEWWEWLTERVGVIAPFARSLVTGGRSSDAIAFGLCARLLLGSNDVETARVHGRYEQLAGLKLDDLSLAHVVDAAERACQPRDLVRGDALVDQLEAKALAVRSDLLPKGFALRLRAAGEALTAALTNPTELSGAVESLESCRQHRERNREPERLEALALAIRLARRLPLAGGGEPASLAEAATRFASDSSFVDHARERVMRGESEPTLIAAYQELDERLLALREAENSSFARLLADWLQGGSADPRILGVEQVIPSVIVPLATDAPVLLVVMDGMTWANWVDLSADLPRLGWDEIVSEQAASRLVGIATVPSATTYSRTSLLSGDLQVGVAKEETKGFAAAFAGKVSGATLFHKADLVPAGGGVVAPDVISAISDAKRRVVGIVINEIDDALAGGLQADRRFRIPEIGPLMTCLDAARSAGRVCVITADHGHVVEYNVTYRSTSGNAERWRPAADGAEEGEIVLAGRRVLAGNGTIVAPWTERVRYTSGKNAGYHGGATPQEMLVPVAVLAPRGKAISGWRTVGPSFPEWWDDDAPPLASAPAVVRPAVTLLDPGASGPAWIDRLLATELYSTQRQRHARVAVDDDRARSILACIAGRGNRATTVAIAQALDLPEHRARGVISGLRRVLAVDGFDVLMIADDDVTLDQPLLLQQFGIVGASTT